MRTDLFDYRLPHDLIAQSPIRRSASRMLVLGRTTGDVSHRFFTDLPGLLEAGDLVVLNNTEVSARRLVARRAGGGVAEVLLLERLSPVQWSALVRPGRALPPGKELTIIGPAPHRREVVARMIAVTPHGGRVIEVEDPAISDEISTWGRAPLPPYIETPLPRSREHRYQTVYATQPGSAAAPTAGLHFTHPLLQRLRSRGVGVAFVTLHVGIGTFRPVRTGLVEEHQMQSEMTIIDEDTAEAVNRAVRRVLAVGTTTVRALESAVIGGSGCRQRSRIRPMASHTPLFITPGYRFRVVDAILTNFHLPRSTPLVLAAAFAGREAVLSAYATAVDRNYRFLSFGDAMLIL